MRQFINQLILHEQKSSNHRPEQAEQWTRSLLMDDKRIPIYDLMNVQMPIINGYETAKAIRTLENGREVPIISLTAGTVMGEKERCIQAGMKDYVK